MQQHIHGLIKVSRTRNLTTIDKEYLICILDRIEAVRDDHPGGGRRQTQQYLFEHLFRNRVDIGRSLIQDQQLRVAEDGTDKGDKLFLPQADTISRRNDLGGKPFVKPGKQCFQPGLPQNGKQVFIREIFVASFTTLGCSPLPYR